MSAGPTCWPTPNARAPWTDEDERDLKEMALSGYTVREAARDLGRTVSSVAHKAHLMRVSFGSVPGSRTRTSWTDEEDARLSAEIDRLAHEFQRTAGAVVSHAAVLTAR